MTLASDTPVTQTLVQNADTLVEASTSHTATTFTLKV